MNSQNTQSKDMGRLSEGRTLGKGYSEKISHHKLFQGFTYTKETLSSGVKTEKPFYCYDGNTIVIKGRCDYATIAKVMERENLYPIKTPDGKAIFTIWINELKDTVVGRYNEIIISFDASTQADSPRPLLKKGPYALLYNNFTIPTIQFLHTLYISSSLSIEWARELQAFPKHPTPTQLDINFDAKDMSFNCAWDEQLVIKGQLKNQWSIKQFFVQSTQLIHHFGLLSVLRFLFSNIITLPIRMPQCLKNQYHIDHDHTGHILKGYNPIGIRVWPWQASFSLELGVGLEEKAEPGRESATDLLQNSHFIPEVIAHIPSLQLVVVDH